MYHLTEFLSLLITFWVIRSHGACATHQVHTARAYSELRPPREVSSFNHDLSVYVLLTCAPLFI